MRSSARNELSRRVLEGGYRLLEPIGQGGSSIVFEAEHLPDQRKVAVKMLQSEHATHPDLCARLLREAVIGSSLNAAFIARTLDVGHLEDGSPYVVMERLKGESLSHLLLRVRSLPADEAFALGARLARILAAVHAQGIVHRDLKPEHVWLERHEDGELDVRLIDFGVAQVEDQLRGSVRHHVYGTPGYLAPEQALLAGPVDGRADLYALGIVLFEMIAGERPFAGNAAVLLRRTVEEDVPPSLRAELSSLASRVLRRLYARDVSARFSSARAAERALRQLTRGVSSERALARRLMPAGRPNQADVSVDTRGPTRNAALM